MTPTPELLSLSTAKPVPKKIAFLDPRVPDYQALLDGIRPDVMVVILDAQKDGVVQISAVLADQKDISAVHILSHGGPGTLPLGSISLSFATLSDYSEQLQGWARSLTPEADILLYGCDVAAGAQGDAFIYQLSQLTGAEVAASDNKTGDAEQGGDWLLEDQTGGIETGLIVAPETRESYRHLLPLTDSQGVVLTTAQIAALTTTEVSIPRQSRGL
ncbi:MAG: DUF4347 domain-containing protein [Magnetococcus sp. MYC-9]